MVINKLFVFLFSDQSDEEIINAGRTFAKSFMNFNNFLSDLNMTFSSYLDKIMSLDLTSKLAAPKVSTPTNNNPSSLFSTDQTEIPISIKKDTFNFMRGIMDECTHLANFSSLVDPELVIIIKARHDAYVPSHGVIPLTDIWKGSTVRYLNRGHISAILLDNNEFRKAIADSLNMNALKYYGTSLYIENVTNCAKIARSN